MQFSAIYFPSLCLELLHLFRHSAIIAVAYVLLRHSGGMSVALYAMRVVGFQYKKLSLVTF